jgi:hypothetical protein
VQWLISKMTATNRDDVPGDLDAYSSVLHRHRLCVKKDHNSGGLRLCLRVRDSNVAFPHGPGLSPLEAELPRQDGQDEAAAIATLVKKLSQVKLTEKTSMTWLYSGACFRMDPFPS